MILYYNFIAILILPNVIKLVKRAYGMDAFGQKKRQSIGLPHNIQKISIN